MKTCMLKVDVVFCFGSRYILCTHDAPIKTLLAMNSLSLGGNEGRETSLESTVTTVDENIIHYMASLNALKSVHGHVGNH